MSTELNQTSSCLGVPSSLSSSTGIVQVADEDQMDQTCLGYRLRALFDVFRCCTLLFRSSCLEATVIWPQRIRRAQSGAVSTIYSRDGEWIHTEFNGFRISPPYHIISYAREPNYPQIIPNEGRWFAAAQHWCFTTVWYCVQWLPFRISWLWREWHWQLVGRHDIHSHLMDPGSEWLESLRWALSSHAPCITMAMSWEKWTPCRQHRHRTACNFGSEHCRVRHDLVKFNAAQPEPDSMLN